VTKTPPLSRGSSCTFHPVLGGLLARCFVQGIIFIFCIFVSVEGIILHLSLLFKGSFLYLHSCLGGHLAPFVCPGGHSALLITVQGVILCFNSCPEGDPTCSFLFRGSSCTFVHVQGIFLCLFLSRGRNS